MIVVMVLLINFYDLKLAKEFTIAYFSNGGKPISKL